MPEPLSHPLDPASRRPPWGVILTCAVLLAVFATLAYLAVRSKSPTFDEPLHALGAWLHLHTGDFRVNPEDPPLWHYWAALPNGPKAITVDTSSTRYAQVAADIYQEWPFVVETLYPCGRSLPLDSDKCPDSDTFILRSRRMMLALGVVLGALVAWWGWQLGGGVAAVVATALFALDPNFLGHAPLVKNDVPLTLIMTGLILSVWRAGRRLSPWNALAIALLCAAAVTTKFSGLLLGPIVAVMLLTRAVMSEPWQTSWRALDKRLARVLVAIVLLISAAAISWGGLWAAYFFRYGPSPDPQIQLGFVRMTDYTARAELASQLGRVPTDEEVRRWEPSRMTRVVLWLEDVRLVPQAWLYGLLYTYQSALARMTFLLGEFSVTGWWYYFPVAMATKTPVTALLAAGLAIWVMAKAARLAGARAILTWTAACLFIPPAIYLASAMRSNLNLGLRHVLPVYPFIYLGIGLATAYAWRNRRRITRRIALVLAIALIAETVIAYPNYVAFFNVAAGGSRGGLRILGDSNLDWGQDLKLLAKWQKEHPGENLYLAYFGLADPWAYGIRYFNFPGGYRYGPPAEWRSDPGVLAISATHLQAIYQHDYYAALRQVDPIEVLGGTIYLYRWPVIRESSSRR